MSKKQCFIAMPISTPQEMVKVYSNDDDHFKHVLEFLFIPAIEAAGYEPVPPISKGAEVIHAEIINNIQSSDYLLCDMSILNPNVFFELGIRTALNKPVALVKDDATPKVPFDTAILNNHTYLHSLTPWVLKDEISRLSEHLSDCFEKGDNNNSLWKYFSISSTAMPLIPDQSESSKIDYLGMQIEALRRDMQHRKPNVPHKDKNESKEKILFHSLINMAPSDGVRIAKATWDEGIMTISTTEHVPIEVRKRWKTLAHNMGITLKYDVEKQETS